jgi:hypothetical protein
MMTVTGSRAATAPVHADQPAEDRGDNHECDQQLGLVGAAETQEELARPNANPGRLDSHRDGEQRGDQDHHRVTEAGQSLRHGEDTGEVERQGGPDRDDDRRHRVPGEQHQRQANDRQRDRDVVHGILRTSQRGALSIP